MGPHGSECNSHEAIRSRNRGPEKGVITKGVFSLEESLESLKSLNSLESLENGRGVAPANQTKERSVHELFAGAFRNKSSM